MLDKGFGLFTQSTADVLLLLEQELSRLREVAFRGGPRALVQEALAVARRIEEERAAADDQDVIDGLNLNDPDAVAPRRSLWGNSGRT